MTVVKADGYGHGIVECGRAARAGGADVARRGHGARGARAARRAATPAGCCAGSPSPPTSRTASLARAIDADVDITAYTVDRLDEIVAAVSRATAARACSSRSTPGSPAAARPSPTGRNWWPQRPSTSSAGRAVGSPASGRTSPAATSPSTPPTTCRSSGSARRLRVAEDGRAAARGPTPRQLGGRDPAARAAGFDLVRVGLASYGLDPLPTLTHDPGLRPAMTVTRAARPRQADRRGRGRLLRPHLGRRRGDDRRPGARRVRRRRAPPRQQRARGGGRRRTRPVRGRVCMDQVVVDLGGDLPPVGTPVVLFGPGDHGRAHRAGLGRWRAGRSPTRS